ncbi:MAG: glutamate--tRNA ligase [Chlamydiia bacterium]|nr:glutamate--tRNA ligase [Chlamydiia bacterium]
MGGVRTALYNHLFAKQTDARLILRIEDTDRKRFVPGAEEAIYDSFRWCGIPWDEGPDCGGPHAPYRQSERTEIYRVYAQQLIDKGMAYKCFATAEELAEMREVLGSQGSRVGYDRRYRYLSEAEVREREAGGELYVIRLKVPLKGECVFEDGIRGRIVFPWADVDDQILMKSDGFPTYHLANVVDDHLMEISHVIRGEEWMSSTPKHILLYEAFGWQAPQFLHMPLLLDPDGKKLSKRRNPTSIAYYRDSGYLPEAFTNFLTLMGYSMSGDREIYPLQTLIDEFDPKRIGASGAVFDTRKLDWINQHYLINEVPEDQLWNKLNEWCFSQEKMKALIPLVRTRMKTFGDFFDQCDFFFTNNLNYTDELFAHAKNLTKSQASCVLQVFLWELDARGWERNDVYDASKKVAEIFEIHHKKSLMPLLFAAIMGKLQGPPLFDSVTILGRHLTRARLYRAMEFLGGLSKKALHDLEKGWGAGDCRFLISENKSE